MSTISESLAKLIDFIEDESRHCKGSWAFTKGGNMTSPLDPKACRWCLLGAIYKLFPAHYSAGAALILSAEGIVLRDFLEFQLRTGLVGYNDNHSHKEIMERLRWLMKLYN